MLVCLLINVFIFLFIHLNIYLFVYSPCLYIFTLFISSSIHLFICQSIHLFGGVVHRSYEGEGKFRIKAKPT